MKLILLGFNMSYLVFYVMLAILFLILLSCLHLVVKLMIGKIHPKESATGAILNGAAGVFILFYKRPQLKWTELKYWPGDGFEDINAISVLLLFSIIYSIFFFKSSEFK